MPPDKKRQFTVCVNTPDVPPRLFALPAYTAVIECDPCASEEVVNVAFPLPSDIVCKTVAPSLNVTEPAGVPLPGGTAATVAVSVTDWPSFDGFNEEVNVVEVAALLTVCVKAEDVMVLKFALPLYVAVME